MQAEALVYPLFAMTLLTGVVMLLVFTFRIKAMLAGKLDPYFLENKGLQSAAPFMVRLTRNLSNLFEFPVLFYVACILLIALDRVDQTYILLAWTYVAIRYIHSIIHITYNKLLHRSSVHFLGDMVLIVIWLRIVTQTAGIF